LQNFFQTLPSLAQAAGGALAVGIGAIGHRAIRNLAIAPELGASPEAIAAKVISVKKYIDKDLND